MPSTRRWLLGCPAQTLSQRRNPRRRLDRPAAASMALPQRRAPVVLVHSVDKSGRHALHPAAAVPFSPGACPVIVSASPFASRTRACTNSLGTVDSFGHRAISAVPCDASRAQRPDSSIAILNPLCRRPPAFPLVLPRLHPPLRPPEPAPSPANRVRFLVALSPVRARHRTPIYLRRHTLQNPSPPWLLPELPGR